jgi:hypothetical protein
MYYTPQQLSGGPKYGFKSRMGNWNEDWTAHDHKLKEYMAKKDNDALTITSTQQKFAKSGQSVPHTFREDGTIEYNDCLLLKSCATNGTLVCDMSDRVGSSSEGYMVTTRAGEVGAIARSVYTVCRANPKQSLHQDNKVRFGDEVRIKTNAYICHKDLYLHSCPISPLAYARFSRNQEVSLNASPNYNTVWRILPAPGNGFYGELVKSGVPVVFEHCGTQQNLSNDRIPYRNDFGDEIEVSAKANATLRKTQMCEKERTGIKVREETFKEITNQNHWTLELASEPTFTPEEASKVQYSGKKLVSDVRDALCQMGLLAIRGLMTTFSKFDRNRDQRISADELRKGLEKFQIFLNDDQVSALLADFDTDRSGTIDFREFSTLLLVSNAS